MLGDDIINIKDKLDEYKTKIDKLNYYEQDVNNFVKENIIIVRFKDFIDSLAIIIGCDKSKFVCSINSKLKNLDFDEIFNVEHEVFVKITNNNNFNYSFIYKLCFKELQSDGYTFSSHCTFKGEFKTIVEVNDLDDIFIKFDLQILSRDIKETKIILDALQLCLNKEKIKKLGGIK